MKKHDQKSIGKALQRVRKDAGYKSARAFAEHIEMNPGTYRNYEQGDRPFSLETAWDMADALNVSLDQLAGREWPPGGSPALSADERGLVSSYRKMDPPDREKLRGVADTFVVASEKDGTGAAGDVARSGVAIANE